MADLTHRIATSPLVETGDGWEGDCLAERCRGTRGAEAWGSEDGATPQVVTACGTCGRVEVEPAPGMTQDPLPGMEATCCDLHRNDCCDPTDCGPCCPGCPTCPTLARGRNGG